MLRVRIGPVDAASARAWIENTTRIVDAVQAHADSLPFQVPDEVAATFRRYLASWREEAAGGDVFDWTGEADAAEVHHLVLYWFNIDTMPDEDLRRIGADWSGPEAEPFFLALTEAILAALDDDERTASFSQALRDAWPRSSRFPANGTT